MQNQSNPVHCHTCVAVGVLAQKKQFRGCIRQPKSQHKNSRQATSAVTSYRRRGDGRRSAERAWVIKKKSEKKKSAGHFAGRLALDTSPLNSLKAERNTKRETASSFRPFVVPVDETANGDGGEQWSTTGVSCMYVRTYIGAWSKEAYVPAAF